MFSRKDDELLLDALKVALVPYIESVNEVLRIVSAMEERSAYAERIGRLEARLEHLEGVEARVRELEQQRASA